LAVFGLAGHTCMPAHTEGAANAASPHNGIQQHSQPQALITSFTSMTQVSYMAETAMSTSLGRARLDLAQRQLDTEPRRVAL